MGIENGTKGPVMRISCFNISIEDNNIEGVPKIYFFALWHLTPLFFFHYLGQMDKKKVVHIHKFYWYFPGIGSADPPPTRSLLRSKFIFLKIQISWTFQGNHIGLKKLQTAQQNFQGSKKCQYFQKDSNVDIFRGPMGPPPKQKFFGSKNGYLGSLRVPLSFPEFFRMFLNFRGGEGSTDPILGNFHSFYTLFF